MLLLHLLFSSWLAMCVKRKFCCSPTSDFGDYIIRPAWPTPTTQTFSLNLATMVQYLSRSPLRFSTRFASNRRVLGQPLKPTWIRFMSSEQSYEYILISRPEPSVLLVTLNRPKSLNALSSPLFKELNHALEAADKDDSVGAMVLTGSERAFAGVSSLVIPGSHSAFNPRCV
jgi:hypothetical protein